MLLKNLTHGSLVRGAAPAPVASGAQKYSPVDAHGHKSHFHNSGHRVLKF